MNTQIKLNSIQKTFRLPNSNQILVRETKANPQNFSPKNCFSFSPRCKDVFLIKAPTQIQELPSKQKETKQRWGFSWSFLNRIVSPWRYLRAKVVIKIYASQLNKNTHLHTQNKWKSERTIRKSKKAEKPENSFAVVRLVLFRARRPPDEDNSPQKRVKSP